MGPQSRGYNLALGKIELNACELVAKDMGEVKAGFHSLMRGNNNVSVGLGSSDILKLQAKATSHLDNVCQQIDVHL